MYKLNSKDFGNIIFILKMCDDIKTYQEEKQITKLLVNRMSINAILMNISQIGEYANKLSDEFLNNFDKDYWKQLINIRHRIVHDYGGIDLAKIEDVLRIHIDILIDKCFDIINIFKDDNFYISLTNEKIYTKDFNSKYILDLWRKNSNTYFNR